MLVWPPQGTNGQRATFADFYLCKTELSRGERNDLIGHGNAGLRLVALNQRFCHVAITRSCIVVTDHVPAETGAAKKALERAFYRCQEVERCTQTDSLIAACNGATATPPGITAGN